MKLDSFVDNQSTELILTRGQAKDAIEFWLNEKFLKEPGRVIRLDYKAQGGQFIVGFTMREEEEI